MARWISIVAHPFVIIAVMVMTAAARLGAPGATIRTLGVVALFSILPVGILTVYQVRRGAWKNVDASNPQDRPILFAVGMAGIVGLVCYALLRQPDSFLVRGSTGALGLLVVSAVATRWVKVSLHVAAAGLAATALILLGSMMGWYLAAVVPLLAWSRVVLGRHTPIEVAFGLAFGVLAGLAIHLA